MGVIDNSGEWLVLTVDHFSPWDFNFPAIPMSGAFGTNMVSNETADALGFGAQQCGNSAVELATGDLTIERPLPSYQIFGQKQELHLVYQSRTVSPQALITYEKGVDPLTTLVPDQIGFKAIFQGNVQEKRFGGSEETGLFKALFEGKSVRGEILKTGIYDYIVELTHYYPATYATANCFACPPVDDLDIATDELMPLTSRLTSFLSIDNRIASPFGAGWSLAGLKRLYKEPSNQRILLVDGNGRATPFIAGGIETIAGNGSSGNSGDEGLATEASMNFPTGLAVDPQGNIYVSIGTSDVIRMIDTQGIIHTIAGTGGSGYSGDGGPALEATFDYPGKMAIDSQGNLYVVEAYNRVIRKIGPAPDRIVTTFAGTGAIGYSGDGGLATDATFKSPSGIAVDGEDNVFVADSVANVIRRIDASTEIITTVVGTGQSGYTGDGEPATEATLHTPVDVAIDQDGNLYIVDSFIKVVRKVDSQGIISTVAGSGVPGYSGDGGVATNAQMGGVYGLRGVSVDGQGNVYIADRHNNNIRKVDVEGIITTYAGNGENNYNGDTGLATATAIARPNDLVVDKNGGLIISDELNRRIRRVANSVYQSQAGGLLGSLVQLENGGFRLEQKNQSKEYFDEQGLLTRRIDQNGHETLYTYDQENQLIKITDSLGQDTLFTYDSNGKLSSIQDPQGRETEFTFNNNDLTAITLPDGSQWKYEYNNKHHLIKKIDPRLYETTYTYDQYGKITEVESPTGEIRKYKTGWAQGIISEIPDGTKDNPAEMILSGSILSTSTDGRGNVTTYEFDRYGQIEKKTDAEGNTTITKRNSRSLIEEITTPLGITHTYKYNPHGDLIEQWWDVDKGINKTILDYNDNRQVTYIETPTYDEMFFTYDTQGHLLTYTDTENATTSWFYNSNGLPETMTNALNETTSFGYNNEGNLQTITDPLGNTTTLGYDNASNVNVVTDANGNSTGYTYDDLNRLTLTTDARNNTLTYSYGQIGCGCEGSYDRVTAITDANGNKTVFEYNGLGQLMAKTDPLGNTETYAYDLARNLSEHIDRNDNVITYNYDAMNRLIQINRPDGATNYSYDAMGNLLSAANPDQTVDMTYTYIQDLNAYLPDNIKVSGTGPGDEMTYEYPLGGKTTRIYDILGKTTVSRNDRYEIISKSFPDKPMIHDSRRDAVGRIIEMDMESKYTAVYTYDPAGRLTNMDYNILNQPDHFHNYTMDNVGNRLSETDFYGTHAYTYDPLDELLADSLTGEDFIYDALGNRLTDKNGNSYVYGPGNRLQSVATEPYAYDVNGNLVSKTVSGVTWTYTWNSQNQLIEVTNTSGLSAAFMYDPFGRRIEKDINGTIRRYVYEGDHIRFIYDENNTLLYSFNFGPGMDNVFRMTDQQTGLIYTYLKDGRGSVYQVQDTSVINGLVVKSYQYDDFGNIINETGTFENSFTYTGREWEPELGLYYYRARWYDPAIGRFISEDPIGFGGGDTNLYAYVWNNPSNLTDPEGLSGLALFARPYFITRWSVPRALQRMSRNAPKNDQCIRPHQPQLRYTPRPAPPIDEIIKPKSGGKWLELGRQILETIEQFSDYFSAPPINVYDYYDQAPPIT